MTMFMQNAMQMMEAHKRISNLIQIYPDNNHGIYGGKTRSSIVYKDDKFH
jgi:dipeptidyl-peptidase-4